MSEIRTGTMYTMKLHDMLLHGQDFGMAIWGEDFSKMHIDPYWQWVKTGTEQEEVNAYLMVISQAKEIARLRVELKEIEDARMLTTEIPDSWIEDEDEDEDKSKFLQQQLTKKQDWIDHLNDEIGDLRRGNKDLVGQIEELQKWRTEEAATTMKLRKELEQTIDMNVSILRAGTEQEEVDYLRMITNMLLTMNTNIEPVMQAFIKGPVYGGEYQAMYHTLVKYLVIPLQQWAMDLGNKRVIPDWMWAVKDE